MKRILSLISIALCFASVSCTDEAETPLKADFEVDKASVLVGDVVTFNDLSTGKVTRWNWTFEGATPETSVLTQPQIQYMDAGKYNVTLSVSNKNNSDQIMKTEVVTVAYHNSVTADFEISKTRAYSDETITFTNKCTGFPNNIKWTFTPKSGTPIINTEASPMLTFEPGLYSVKLEISNPIASGTKEIEDALLILDPNAVTTHIHAPNATTYEGGKINFTSEIEGPVKTYEWVFDGGTPSTSTEANPSVAYSKVGSYKVSLTVRNGSYSDTDEIEGYVHVIPADGLVFLLPLDGDIKDYGPNTLKPELYSKSDYAITFQEGSGHAQSAKFPGGVKGASYCVIKMPDALSEIFPAGSDATYSFWAKTPAVEATQGIIAQGDCPGTPNASNQIWARFQTKNAFRVLAETTGKSSTGNTITNTRFQDDTWHNFLFKYYNSGKDFEFYLDGEKISEAHYTDVKYEKQTSSQPFFIGANIRFTSGAWAPENMYEGLLDDFILYKKALSAEEIKSLCFQK